MQTSACNVYLAVLAFVLLIAIYAYAISQPSAQTRSNFSTESAAEAPERISVPYTGTEPINSLGNGAVPWSESAYEMVPRRTALDLGLEPSLLAAGYARAYPAEPTVRDGTVAPIHAGEPPAMVRKGLHADSAGIAAYMADGTSQPAIGIARFGWFRAMDDAQAGAAARARKPDPAFELTPGEPGTLVPESARGDRPLGMPRQHMLAGYADGGNSAIGYNSRFIPDGPYIA